MEGSEALHAFKEICRLRITCRRGDMSDRERREMCLLREYDRHSGRGDMEVAWMFQGECSLMMTSGVFLPWCVTAALRVTWRGW